MAELDVKDLKILAGIYRLRSLSALVDELGLAQPSISIRLAKLRSHFDDPLFVRSSTGMQPTTKMDSIIESVRQAIALLEDSFEAGSQFDPAHTQRTVRISLTDGAQLVFLPRLLDRLRSVAPRIRIDAIPLEQNTARMLESGESDLALGFTYDIPGSFFQQTLFTEHYVCLLRNDHPRVGQRLSLKRFLEEAHIQVASKGTGHWMMIKALRDLGVERNIAVQVHSFLALAQIVAQTNLIALVPAHMARLLTADVRIRTLRAPIALPTYDIKQYWHERTHRDPCHQWIRSQIMELFVE